MRQQPVRMVDNLQSTDLEEWDEIGKEVQQIYGDMIELVDSFNSVPKTVWRDEYNQAKDGIDNLKDVLDTRLFEEHGKDAGVDTFYGGAG